MGAQHCRQRGRRSAIICFAVAVAALGQSSGLAGWAYAEGPVYLVKDVTDGTDPLASSNPYGFIALGELVLFAADDEAHGNELWRTDGTAAGTVLVKDIAPGSDDGVAGTARAVVDDVLYFTGAGGIWRSDGTEDGTRLLSAVAASHLVADRGRLFAVSPLGNRVSLGFAVWRIDLPGGETTLLREFPDSDIDPSPTMLDGRLFFAAVEGFQEGLWLSDGTSDGTRAVRTITLANREGGNENTEFIAVGGQLFFVARDESGWELWRSDGTPDGTRRVRDIYPGPRSGIHFNDYWEAAVPFFTAYGDILLFLARDETTGLELWRSDGTEAGTVRLSDAGEGPVGLDGTDGNDDASDLAGHVIRLVPFAGQVYFTAQPEAGSLSLWVSDGTADGTREAASILPTGGEVRAAVAGSHHLFFEIYGYGDSSRGGRALVITDGTAIERIGALSSSGLAPAWDGAVFAGDDGRSGREPWFSDGSVAGTRPIADLNRGRPGLDPIEITDLAGRVLFSGFDSAHGRELWRSDGTAEGTLLVADIRPGEASSDPQEFVVSATTLYFSATDSIRGSELWRSDGTASGTALVRDINPGAGDSSVSGLIADGRGGVYFLATEPTSGRKFWHSDGTAAGTVPVYDIDPARNAAWVWSNVPGAMRGDVLVFGAFDPMTEAQLWRSDGTALGTVAVSDLLGAANPSVFVAIPDAVLFFVDEPSSGELALWRSDGTAAGTTRLANVGYGYLSTLPVATGDGRIVFVTSRSRGYALWQSDGRAAGTAIIGDTVAASGLQLAAANGEVFALSSGVINPSGALSRLNRIGCGVLLDSVNSLSNLIGFGDRLLFTDTSAHGQQRLWASDGTPFGTVEVQALPAPAAGASRQNRSEYQFTRSGDRVYFTAADESGRELWALPVDALPEVDPPECQLTPTPTVRTGSGSQTPEPFECGGDVPCTRLDLDSITAAPGDTVEIGAVLRALDEPIAGIQADIELPLGIIMARKADGTPDCTVNDAIDKPATAFSFQPYYCGADCTQIRSLVLSLGNVDPIPDGSLLYTCRVIVASDALPGYYELRLFDLGASDPDGNAVEMGGRDGVITVEELSGASPLLAASGGGCQMTAQGRDSSAALWTLLPLLLTFRRRRR